MLVLMLEIGLTIAAWKRGWKGWALLPLAIGGASAFLTGVVMGAAGVSDAAAFGLGLVFDIVIVGALIGMVAKRRHIAGLQSVPNQPQPTAPQATGPVPGGEYGHVPTER